MFKKLIDMVKKCIKREEKAKVSIPLKKKIPAPPKKKPTYFGVYSCCGWSGGKLAFLLGTSVRFPYNNEDRNHAWTQNKEREVKLPRAINLGCRRKFIEEDSLNYNSENSIDKVEVFNRFDKLKIPHPRLIDPKTFEGKFLGRKNKASRGRGIQIYEPGAKKIAEHDFFVELLDCKSEHRIHFFMGEVVCELNKKIKEGSVIHTAEQGSPLELGPIVHPKRKKMIKYGALAVEAMELDFGAVDIFVDKNDDVYILEVNSDPGMSGLIGFLYADCFRKHFKLESPLDKKAIVAKGNSVEVNLEAWCVVPKKEEEKKK